MNNRFYKYYNYFIYLECYDMKKFKWYTINNLTYERQRPMLFIDGGFLGALIFPESFFENLGRRIDERLAKTSEAQTIRNRAVLQTDADWRDRYRVMV